MTFRKQLKARYRSNRGFTLIEVLVSLTIMALITGVAFAGLSIGIDSWERGSRKIEELDRRFSVERLIQRQLPLAVPGQFVGRSNELEFISTYSVANGPTDPVIVKYVFDSGRLSYTETPVAEYTARNSETTVSQPLGAFSQIRFRYLGGDAEGKPAWIDEWNEDHSPPVIQAQVDEDILVIPTVNRQ